MILLPSSFIKDRVLGPKAPRVSIATGTKQCACPSIAGLFRSDGKHPDRATLVSLARGVWDATCLDTLAPSYWCHTTSAAGKVASAAEEKGLQVCRFKLQWECGGGGGSTKNELEGRS